MYIIPVFCLAAALVLRKGGVRRAHRALWVALIDLSMLAQSAVLILDGTWSIRTGLPLHVCGFSGIMSLPALMWPSPSTTRFFRRVALPGAMLALLFPAVYPTRYMLVGEISFFLLHSLLVTLPLLLPRERDGKTGMYRLCLLLLISAVAVNEVFQANYLFLRALPSGAPFEGLNALPTPVRAFLALMLAICLSYARKRQKIST